MVMPVNDNRVLCTLVVKRSEPCDEMATVYRALDDMRRLQDYVDAQAGGPGKLADFDDRGGYLRVAIHDLGSSAANY